MTKAEQEWSLIEALEYCKKKRPSNKSCAGCPYAGVGCAIDAAIALLQAQEPIEARLHLCESCAKEYAECEADKNDLVYGNGVGNDNIIGCPWYMNRWKVQEPVEPTKDENSTFWYWRCGECGVPITEGDKFCRMCGRGVKWNDER